ncbi:MAG: DUF2341 domain-containing protein [archaeon YNP-WB-062]|nr:DUF2341 domain-containing protein [Candidatus Culexarchaeum yellowstonense]
MPTLAQSYLFKPNNLYMRPVIIDNTQNQNSLSDYQILLILDTASLISAGKMRSDCGDIRFTDSDGVTLLNHWIETYTINTSSTKIWVKVPSIPAGSKKTIYLYYGNLALTSISNGDAVFPFFDDFDDGTLNTGKWSKTEQYGVTYSERDGCAVFSGTSTAASFWQALASITTINSFTPPFIVRARKKSLSGSGTGYHIHVLLRYSSSSLTSYYEGYDSGWSPYYMRRKLIDTTDSLVEGISSSQLGADEIWDVVVTSTQTMWYVDGVLKSTDSKSWTSANLVLYGRARYSGDNVTAMFDYVFIRKYTSPEPTISLGSETYIARLPDSI